MGGRIARRVLVLAVLGGLIAACLASRRPNLNPDTQVVARAGTYVLMETEAYEGDVGGVGVTGTITLLPGNCVGFDEELIVFPPRTEVSTDDAGEVVIHVAGDELNKPVDLRIGDHVEGGTRLNGRHRADLAAFGDLAEQVPSRCRDLPAVPVDELRKTTT